MIGYDFRMHHAGVFLHLFMLVIVLGVGAIEVNRPYLRDRRKRQCAAEN